MLGITNDPSSPGSVITTSQAAFGEYESLEASGPVERLDGRNGLAGDAEEASTSTATMSTTSNTSKDTADTTRTTSTRLNHATAALINTLVGAGIVALPKAFLSLGVLPGVILLLSFYFLSRYTLAAMIRSASTVGVWTYDELVRSQFGSVGAISLDTAIVVNNLGGLLIFLIIIGDLMVGTPPHYSGIVTNAFGMHGGDVWWLSREFVVGAVSFLVLFPLVSLRDISGLGKVSAYSVSVAIGLVGTIGMLAVVAAYEGRLATDVSVWLPNVHVLDDGRRTEDCSILRAAVSFLAILPVIAVPFCCHYNLFPVATNLERFSDRRIAMVIRRSLVVCTALYAVMAVSGVALFGSATEGNLLLNLRPAVVESYLPEPIASILCLGVRVLYLLVIVSSFPMLNWALRETASSYLFGSRTLEGQRKFVCFSFALVLGEYVLSIVFPDIWVVMSLSGCTAAVYVMFILPGALVYKTSERGEDFFLSRFLIAFGCVMMVFGIVKNM